MKGPATVELWMNTGQSKWEVSNLVLVILHMYQEHAFLINEVIQQSYRV